jgi:hypothetical protein
MTEAEKHGVDSTWPLGKAQQEPASNDRNSKILRPGDVDYSTPVGLRHPTSHGADMPSPTLKPSLFLLWVCTN